MFVGEEEEAKEDALNTLVHEATSRGGMNVKHHSITLEKHEDDKEGNEAECSMVMMVNQK